MSGFSLRVQLSAGKLALLAFALVLNIVGGGLAGEAIANGIMFRDIGGGLLGFLRFLLAVPTLLWLMVVAAQVANRRTALCFVAGAFIYYFPAVVYHANTSRKFDDLYNYGHLKRYIAGLALQISSVLVSLLTAVKKEEEEEPAAQSEVSKAGNVAKALGILLLGAAATGFALVIDVSSKDLLPALDSILIQSSVAAFTVAAMAVLALFRPSMPLVAVTQGLLAHVFMQLANTLTVVRDLPDAFEDRDQATMGYAIQGTALVLLSIVLMVAVERRKEEDLPISGAASYRAMDGGYHASAAYKV